MYQRTEFMNNVRVGNYVNISMRIQEYGDFCTMDFKYVKVHHMTKQYIIVRKLVPNDNGYTEHKLPKPMMIDGMIHGNEMPTELVEQLWEKKQIRLMADFNMLRQVECVICYESNKGCYCVTCDTCKHSVCFSCSNRITRTPSNKVLCPMCRTPY